MPATKITQHQIDICHAFISDLLPALSPQSHALSEAHPGSSSLDDPSKHRRCAADPDQAREPRMKKTRLANLGGDVAYASSSKPSVAKSESIAQARLIPR
jgi:hypothetical protein